MSDDLADISLDRRQRDALERVLDHNTSAALAGLTSASGNGRVCAICIFHEQDDSLIVSDLLLCDEQQRESAIADFDLAEDWMDLWSPSFFEEGEECQVSLEVDDSFVAAREIVRAALEERVLDPPRWVLSRVARRLSTESLPFPVTEDLVVFVSNDELGGEFIEELRFVASPQALASLRARGLIGALETTEDE